MLKIPDSDRERGRFLKQALSYFSAISDHISAVFTEFVVQRLMENKNQENIDFVELEIENILDICSENKVSLVLERFLSLKFEENDKVIEKHETSKFTLSEHLVGLLRDCLDRAMVIQKNEDLKNDNEDRELLELRAAIGTSLSLLQDIISAKSK